MDFIEQYLQNAKEIIDELNVQEIERMVNLIGKVKLQAGRMFFIGVGGGAGHASHAVNDFRKICGIEAYSPVDNVSELTARINDEGWDTSFSSWLKASNLNGKDLIFVFSVGGGSVEKNISMNIVKALMYAKERGACICGVVGRDGGSTEKLADACIVIPPVNKDTITAQTEGFQAVIWHLIVSHPQLMSSSNKWESVVAAQTLK